MLYYRRKYRNKDDTKDDIYRQPVNRGWGTGHVFHKGPTLDLISCVCDNHLSFPPSERVLRWAAISNSLSSRYTGAAKVVLTIILLSIHYIEYMCHNRP